MSVYDKVGAAPEPQREEPRSSCKLTLNAKGQVQAELKRYFGDPDDALQVARLNAQEQMDAFLAWERARLAS